MKKTYFSQTIATGVHIGVLGYYSYLWDYSVEMDKPSIVSYQRILLEVGSEDSTEVRD